jgi:hypothetical protein
MFLPMFGEFGIVSKIRQFDPLLRGISGQRQSLPLHNYRPEKQFARVNFPPQNEPMGRTFWQP